ncbi:MAG: 3-deoxy-manno-octulosonate cytidylyltransferase [Deltaproteobacteria bacterium]|nr:3-deoxy-manno-octulosonate cytidylyltransferase [Deltaproteobacteria bacterium]
MQVALIIPARYNSSRLSGKPLITIAGKTLIERVFAIAQAAIKDFFNIQVVVATEDERVADFCGDRNIACVITPASCRTGSDRAFAAAQQLTNPPDFVVNMQGDNPLAPPWFIRALIEQAQRDTNIKVITPCVALSWAELELLQKNKAITPFSGTCVIRDKNNNAIWFSKNIIPLVRYKRFASDSEKSPVLRHIGIYGYRYAALQRFSSLPRGDYEVIEELEQLRFLENGISIRLHEVNYHGRSGMSGIDSPEDIKRAEAIIAREGEIA